MVSFLFTPDEISRLNHLGITAVILFGSQAQNITRHDSDFDIAVIGPYSKPAYDTVYDMMSQKINRLVDIDIVFLANAPLELQKHVANYGRVLYQKNLNVFANFRQKVMTDYADFAPLRTIYSTATLARISP